MKVRRYIKGEEHALWFLLYETVHKVNSKDYTQAQIEAWSLSQWNLPQWEKRLNKTNSFVSEENNQLVGFAELEENGHIDCLYCDHNWQGKGVGSSLLQAIEQEASKLGIKRLFAEARLTAKGFFEKKGFSIEGGKQCHSAESNLQTTLYQNASVANKANQRRARLICSVRY